VVSHQPAHSAENHLMNPARQSLLIRADASPAIGSGHAMRCLALAKAWQSVGGGVYWLMAESVSALEDRLAREAITLKKIEAVPGSISDAEQTIHEARQVDAAWVVVDGYRFFPDYIRKVKNAGLRVLFLDDDGRFDFYAADAVLNQNISGNAAMYDKRDKSTCLLLGSEYVLLRPEFLAEPQIHDHPKVGRKVLITMGGSDPENVTWKVLQALPNVKIDIEAKVVVGCGYLQLDELRSVAAQLPLKVELEKSPANMAPLMHWADVAVSAAGSTCWELAYMGLPVIVIALSPDQRGIAQGLSESEVAVSLGWHANLTTERIGYALHGLLNDLQTRVGMSERGRKLVDGRGAARVVQALQDSL
jgi:UDP-2,4-diacetamido-2,4,6-trideoxy-beta-L-altropyranose hydrolase